MKKGVLFLLTFVPIVVGYIINSAIAIPGLGAAVFYIIPLLTAGFWFYLGRRYAESTWKFIPSLLIGNATGIISFLLYVWQFVFETAETRNMTLTVLSQMYSAAVPTYLLGGIVTMFESQSNYTGMTTMVAVQAISVTLFIVIFVCGYIWGKKRNN